MTKVETIELIRIMQAYVDGKTIECRYKRSVDVWSSCDPNWVFPTTDYRVKPEPQYRPWTEPEVPVGAILRYKNNAQSVRLLIQRSSEKGMVGPDTNLAYSFIFDHMEHSLTGINGPWLPCGVLIQ